MKEQGELKLPRPTITLDRIVECTEGHHHAVFDVHFGKVGFHEDDCDACVIDGEGYIHLSERLRTYLAADHRVEHLLDVMVLHEASKLVS